MLILFNKFELAINYCKKDGVFHECGSPSRIKQGSRTDLIQLRDDIKAGKSIADVADDHFGTFLRYEKSIRSYIALQAQVRNFKTEVYVYWGKTGLGKTRRAYYEAGHSTWFYGSDGWFDGYNGQCSVIFDDFGGHEFKLTYLLKLLDRYPMSVRVKGGFVNWSPRRIYITSNKDPDDWYSCLQVHKEALRRRFTEVIEFQSEWLPANNEE